MFIIFVLLVFALIAYTSFSWGLVTSLFYGWFILPYFPTLPHLGIMAFVGISLFLNTFAGNGTATHVKSEYEDTNKFWTTVILAPWATLLFGWLIKIIFF